MIFEFWARKKIYSLWLLLVNNKDNRVLCLGNISLIVATWNLMFLKLAYLFSNLSFSQSADSSSTQTLLGFIGRLINANPAF